MCKKSACLSHKKWQERCSQRPCRFFEISELLHFDNPQYFSRVFRRINGMSPAEFKNSLER
ncbi:MAG: AraC family transcriptional regulator [Ruminococcaceae bacterium]|nr:AraC family transcriptional regulator [Oscillospiraceae bacterium]